LAYPSLASPAGKPLEYGANRNIFSQREGADSVFYLRGGKVKLAVTSKQGKEAIVAILGDGDFFGEGSPDLSRA
jgi:CRP/FNR family cyclic AMP-dependent transcriptional regulator